MRVRAIIISNAGRLLLGINQDDKYMLPGGKIKDGEHPVDALLREVSTVEKIAQEYISAKDERKEKKAKVKLKKLLQPRKKMNQTDQIQNFNFH